MEYNGVNKWLGKFSRICKWRSYGIIAAFLILAVSAGLTLYQLYEQNQQKKWAGQSLVMPGNDETYSKAIAESYRLLVKRYVVPVSPKILYQSAAETMELIVANWLKDERKLSEEGQKTISQWEREARSARDNAETMSIRAPRRAELSPAETEKQNEQFAQEYEEFNPQKLQRAYEDVLSDGRQDNYYSTEFAQKVYTEVIAALCRPLHDPFSGFFQDSGFYQLSDTTNGSFGGVGLYISKKPDFGQATEDTTEEANGDSSSSANEYKSLQRHYVKVTRPFPSGPSFRAGIMADDFIYAIDDQSAKDWSVEQIQNKMRGMPGTKVKITVLRARKHKIEFEVVREKIEVPAVSSALIPLEADKNPSLTGNILYVELIEFNALAGKQFDKQVRNWLRQGKQSHTPIVAMILDMQHNPGGLLNVAVEIADQFLSAGMLVSTDARTEDNILEFKAKRQTSIPEDLPVYVIVDNDSASAAEIVAGALQDNHRAEVLGQKSFGKGSVQIPVTLPEGILKLTIAHFYTPKGINLANNGIRPDHELIEPELSEAEQKGLLKLLGDALVSDFVSQNHNYTDAEFEEFFDRKIKKKYRVTEERVRRIAYNEKIRYMETVPVYNLDYDLVLKGAVAHIAEKLAQN